MCTRAPREPAKPISLAAEAVQADRPATPASGKSLLHDVNELDMESNDPRQIFVLDELASAGASPTRHSMNAALVEPDGIEPTTSSLQS